MALDFPSAPTIGQTYPGPNGVTWAWDGAKWTTGATSGPPNGALIAATPPSSPVGTLWWDTTGGQLYVLYNDGNSTAWVPASNITGLANAATKADVGQALNDVGRNLIHNPLMAVAQRGVVSVTTSGGYPVDRWLVSATLDAISFAQGVGGDAGRAAIGDEEFNFFLGNTITGNGGPTAFNLIAQRIENVRRLAGKTVIISFWASCGAGALKLGINMLQSLGAGGSPATVQVLTTGNSVTLSTTWTRYSTTIAIPSLAGKTVGTSPGNDHFTALQFFYSAGANTNQVAGNIGVQGPNVQFYLWGVQLEIATAGQTTPTPLEKPDPQQDLAKCQRFYCVGAILWGGYCTAGQPYYASTFLPSMRALPVLTPISDTSSNFGARTLAAAGGMAYVNASATAAAAGTLNVSFSASADL
jgi:hypothetical protein